MTEQELQKIIEDVTAEVLSALPRAADAAHATGAEKILVVGDVSKVPQEIGAQASLYGLDAYEQDRYIAPYSKVIISELTLAQLCDIAQGRPSDSACCAVIQALLNGKCVLLLENGLPHRAFAGRGSTGLYSLLESYVRTLSGFGIKMMTEARLYRPAEVPVKPAKYQRQAEPSPSGNANQNFGSVITEEIAVGMVRSGSRIIRLPRGAILTPSARDIFAKMHVVVEKN